MARGLLTGWKVPIFYAIDTSMRKAILDTIILRLEDHCFNVRGVCFDLGNREFMSDVGFFTGKSSMPNPSDPSMEVYLIPDVPHLLKLFRNHLFQKGISLKTIC